jgi:hypothetical protein
MAIDKDFYNKSSSDSLGWSPEWFGAEFFDEDLVLKVKKWQRERGLLADGLVGPTSYRRIWTEREASISEHKPEHRAIPYYGDNVIVHNGNSIPIEWDKVILWDEDDGLRAKPGTYYNYGGEADRKPNFFVNHWDVCLSSESCSRVLDKRGISVHFCIDNDGTIFQLLDTQHGAWHAGNRTANKRSIGVEISNAYYPKYQDWYVKNGFGKRPLMSDAPVHGGRLGDFLWFYPAQIEALKALWKAISAGLDIPMEYPKNAAGELSTSVHDGCAKATFDGFCNHYNLSRRKIDCAGLELDKLMEGL